MTGKSAAARLAPQTTRESSAHAAQQLRAAIVAGRIRPGARLIETDLAAQLRMSRHPVREALRALHREGLVALRPNRGAVVAEVDAEDVLEVYRIRAALGQLALRQLLIDGPGATPRALAGLEHLALRTVALAAAGEQAPMVRHDLAFQAAIVDASLLPRAAAYFRSLGDEIERFINVLGVRFPDPEATARREVLGLFDAIAGRDHARAERIWAGKLEVAASRLVGMIEAAAGAVPREGEPL